MLFTIAMLAVTWHIETHPAMYSDQRDRTDLRTPTLTTDTHEVTLETIAQRRRSLNFSRLFPSTVTQPLAEATFKLRGYC